MKFMRKMMGPMMPKMMKGMSFEEKEQMMDKMMPMCFKTVTKGKSEVEKKELLDQITSNLRKEI